MKFIWRGHSCSTPSRNSCPISPTAETHPSRFRGQRLSPGGGGAAGPRRRDRRRHFADVERDKLHAVIKRRFGLDEAATDELIAKATEAEQEAVDLYHFTSLLDRSLDEPGRARVIEMMWEIVYADGRVDELRGQFDVARGRPARRVARASAIELRQRVAAHRGERRHEMRPVTLITGASAGSAPRWRGSSPRTATNSCWSRGASRRLDALADEIAAPGGIAGRLVLPSISNAAMRPCASRRASAKRGLEPDIVVNNAGFGLRRRAPPRSTATSSCAMVDLNVRALTELSLAFVDSLARHAGGILNVASVAAFLPGPGMAVYYASKAYVLSFSEALHRGAQAARRARDRALPGAGPDRIPGACRHQQHHIRRCSRASAERVAQSGYRGLKAGRRLVVPGSENKVVTMLVPLVPRGAGARAIDCNSAAATIHRLKACARYMAIARGIRLQSGCARRRLNRRALFRLTSTPCPSDPDRPASGELDARPGRPRLAQLGYALDIRRPRFGDPLPDPWRSMPPRSFSAAR